MFVPATNPLVTAKFPLKALKPEERTLPRVTYRGHSVAMEAKVPKGKVHDPHSYEIETWAQLESQFPRGKRVVWMKPKSA